MDVKDVQFIVTVLVPEFWFHKDKKTDRAMPAKRPKELDAEIVRRK